jgi:hypothetical protein
MKTVTHENVRKMQTSTARTHALTKEQAADIIISLRGGLKALLIILLNFFVVIFLINMH